MGWVARVRSFVRVVRRGARVSDVQVDRGGGDVITAEHFSPAGDDAFPLDTDYAAGHRVQQTGRDAIGGYVDPINAPKALPGDKRIYARDSATGAVVVEVWLKNTGEATIVNDNGSFTLRPNGSMIGDNGSGSFELEAGGDFVVNGVTIDTSGNIDSPATITAPNVVGSTSVKAVGKELGGHTHPAGTPPGNTGTNN